MVNFRKLGAMLTEAELTGKSVDQYSKEQIETLVKLCIESLIPPKEGPFLAPYINDDLDLIIPFEADPKYQWWRPCGQSMAVTLREMKVSDEIWDHYLSTDFSIPF